MEPANNARETSGWPRARERAWLGASLGFALGVMDAVISISAGDFSESRLLTAVVVAVCVYGIMGAVGVSVMLAILDRMLLLPSCSDAGGLRTMASDAGRFVLISVVLCLAVWVGWKTVSSIDLDAPRLARLALTTGLAFVLVLPVLRFGPMALRKRPVTFVVALLFVAGSLLLQVTRGGLEEARLYQRLEASAESAVGVKGLPNIMLVVLDTTRADRLSLYGYSRDTTPFLKALGQESMVYERAISPAPWTLPSHASIFTGVPPAVHRAEHQRRWLDDHFETLAERLAARGYSTVGLSSNSWVGPGFNMSQGFQEYFELYRRIAWYDRDPVQQLGIGTLATRLVGPRYLEDKGAALLNRLAPAWLDDWAERRERRPFFMFINYLEPHLPYNPPEPYRSRYVHRPVRERLEFLLKPDWWLRDKTFELLRRMDQLVPEDLAQLGDLYDGGLAYQDSRLEEIVDALDARGLKDETVLIVTSDHGENLGEHDGLVAHSFSVHQSVLHVPLLIRYPRAFPQGSRHDGLVSTSSVYSTVLQLVGLQWEDEAASIAPPLPRTSDQQGRSFIVSQEDLPVDELSRIVSIRPGMDVRALSVSQRAIQDGKWKLVARSDGGRRLYNMEDDPGEIEPLEPEKIAAGRSLEAELDRWEQGLKLGRPQDVVVAPDLNGDVLKALKALGYVQ